jgi:hypothetical protein
MRKFRFERGGKYALLNGKRYFLRGSNITAYRFFEDAGRGDKPWRTDWVRALHEKVKSMHWNDPSLLHRVPAGALVRYRRRTGHPHPGRVPIWTLGDDPEKLETAQIVPQYVEWMRERWNHPCVVIWDAQNESFIKTSGEALQQVRHLDFSDRPWENGWGEPQSDSDCVESHPYNHIRDWSSKGKEHFQMAEFAKMSGVPTLQGRQRKLKVPIIINEYAWLWLTREGEPTCLTTEVYRHLVGDGATPNQRREVYARYLAAKTEFWRAHRECAGVLHFCTLGYSRPGDRPRPEGGATSDHWIDLDQQSWNPISRNTFLTLSIPSV